MLLIISLCLSACALTTPTDGSGDDRITCFKPEGSIGVKGLKILREIRSQLKAQDGRNDFEEGGISEEVEIDFGSTNDDDILVFTDVI